MYHVLTEQDCPKNLLEFESWFATEEDCRQYLENIRWSEGFSCIFCKGTESWRTSGGLRKCTSCRKMLSPTVGTIFHHTHVPLMLWFRAIWYMTNQRTGISALGLQQMLGLGSYRTAWRMLHKLRETTMRSWKHQLSHWVEIGVRPIAIGGKRGGKQCLVVIAVEEHGSRIGRVRMYAVPEKSEKYLLPFIRRAVVPGSFVHTSNGSYYNALSEYGYFHKASGVSDQQKEIEFPRVHLIATQLSRWLHSTHQGRCEVHHLQGYLSEFIFRFNRRHVEHRGEIFAQLLHLAAQEGIPDEAVALLPPKVEEVL